MSYHYKIVAFVGTGSEAETSNEGSSAVGQNISVHVRSYYLVSSVKQDAVIACLTYDIVVLGIANHFVDHRIDELFFVSYFALVLFCDCQTTLTEQTVSYTVTTC